MSVEKHSIVSQLESVSTGARQVVDWTTGELDKWFPPRYARQLRGY